MMQYILIICSLFISFIFMQMKHPLSMGLTLLIQTLLICLISGNMTKTFWFSYTLFLIFLGGMLILFIYMTSLASNEMFNFSMNLLFLYMMMFFIMTMILLIIDNSLISTFLNNSEMMTISLNENFMKETTINLNKLYNFPTNMITILIINYLLLTMIIIVKITNKFFGPLRQMN